VAKRNIFRGAGDSRQPFLPKGVEHIDMIARSGLDRYGARCAWPDLAAPSPGATAIIDRPAATKLKLNPLGGALFPLFPLLHGGAGEPYYRSGYRGLASPVVVHCVSTGQISHSCSDTWSTAKPEDACS
jgi:hypothetical protein